MVEKSSLPRVIERGDHYQKLAVDGDYVQSGMRFPETIGIFTRAQILDFESRELGHSVMYKSQMGTMLSVYVYGFGGDLDIEIANLESEIRLYYETEIFEVFSNENSTYRVDGKNVNARILLGLFPKHGIGTAAIVMSSGGYFIKYRASAPFHQLSDEIMDVTTVVESLSLPKR